MADSTPPGPPVRFDIGVTPEIQSGVYANFLSVWHTAHDFTLDFASTQPAQEGENSVGDREVRVPCPVVARVKIPVSVVFDIVRAVSDNMSKYEARFGPIVRPGDETPLFPPDIS